MEQRKILITDDEKDIRTMVQVMLDKEGFGTTTAQNGRDAIEKVKENPDFHLIIMDIIMPELNGIEAASEIRKYTDCPILFLTAKSADEDKIKAYDSGGDDYLVKPFSRVELILRVRALLKRYGKENKKIGGISLNVSRRILEKNGQRIQLTGNLPLRRMVPCLLFIPMESRIPKLEGRQLIEFPLRMEIMIL